MDGNVAAMTLQERGAYITLLCICWQEKTLPATPDRLANIVGVPVRAFHKLWPHLSGCFVQHGDRLLHPRLEKEREKQADFSRRQSDKGVASAANRANRKATGVQPESQPEGNSPSLRSPISVGVEGILEFPTVGTHGHVWALTEAQLAEWRGLFPSTDILAEARKALAWVRANPGRRKTAAGMPRFLVNWFSRSVDSGRASVPPRIPTTQASAIGKRSQVPADEPL